MKLDMPEVRVTVSDPNIPMEEFGIGNLGVIMETLRSKIYSNPRRIVIQEIACNARDANREVNKGNIPIRIKLPTRHEPELHITDEGPGIDPIRMKEIYLLLGNSTKRESSEQTGCFGLGSKTPFAYGNSFGIETVAMEADGQLRKRDYIAVVDESRKGKLMLVNTQDSEGPTGTTIKVPVKPADCDIFKEHAGDIFRYWGNSVEFNMKDVTKSEWKPFMEGPDWKLFLQHNTYGVYYYEDGIPYQIESKNLELPKAKLNIFFNEVRLEMFGKGAIQVTATRESIDYRSDVQAHIVDRMLKIYEEINQNISARVQQCSSYWEALILVNENKQKLEGLLDKVQWNGKKVVVGSISFQNANIHCLEKNWDGKVKCRTRNWGFTPSGSTMVFVNDYKVTRPNYLLVKPLYEYAEKEFAALPNKKGHSLTIYVISWKQSDEPTKAKQIADEKAEICFDDWKLKPISDFKVYAKRVSTGGGQRNPVARVRKLTGCDGNYEEMWERAELDLEEDSGSYVVLHEREPVGFDSNFLRTVQRHTGIEIYGIPQRFVEKLGEGWTPLKEDLESYFNAEIANKPSFPEGDSIQFRADNLWQSDVIEILTKAQVNGKIGHYLKLSAEFEKNREKIDFLRWMASTINKPLPPENDLLRQACKDAVSTFPMLNILDSAYCYTTEENIRKSLGISYRKSVLAYVHEIEAKLNADEAEKKAAADKVVVKQEAPKPVVNAEPAPEQPHDKSEVLALPSSEYGILRRD
jgi:hypothetical protein